MDLLNHNAHISTLQILGTNMGLLLSCCRRTKQPKDHEQDPLLPNSQLRSKVKPTPNSLNKVADVAAALHAGKVPSQDQVNDGLRLLLRSFLTDQGAGGGKLSKSGHETLKAARSVCDALLQVGLEKNCE